MGIVIQRVVRPMHRDDHRSGPVFTGTSGWQSVKPHSHPPEVARGDWTSREMWVNAERSVCCFDHSKKARPFNDEVHADENAERPGGRQREVGKDHGGDED